MLEYLRKVSVVMAVYNGEKYIEEQVCSILEQSRKIDEFVIVDDHSEDTSVEKIKRIFSKYRFWNYQIIEHKKNMGYIQTFLTGIAAASGDYIFLADQDDVWLQQKVQVILNLFEQEPDILSVCSSFYLVDEMRNVLPMKKIPNRSNHNILKFKCKEGELRKIELRKIVDYNISPGCTCTFHKKLKEDIQKLKLDKFYLPHDWMINVCAAAKGGLYFYNEKLIEYRQHSDNTIGLEKINLRDKRIQNYYNLVNQKKNIKYIVDSFLDDKSIDKTCTNIINSYFERIKALEKRDIYLLVLSYLKAFFFYKICVDNYYLDFLILAKEKFHVYKK